MSDLEFLPPLRQPGQRHLLHQVVQFSRSLHAAGLPVHPAGLIDFGECLRYVDIGNREEFRAAAEATLVSGKDDMPVFDQVFESFWVRLGEQERELRDREEPPGESSGGRQPPTGRALMLAESGEADPEGEREDEELAWSTAEALVQKDFKDMSETELERARRLLAELIALLARTPGRRTAPSPRRGELDLRRMLRRNALRGGDVIEFRYRRKRVERTRLLLLCDVSGSMERYSRFLIQFIYALRQRLARIEVAVFSTQMTVITDLLERQSVDRSLRQVAERASDWGSGTDIGRSLQAFNDRFEPGMHHSHTVAVLLSDGWDRGDASLMRAEMQRLHSRVHRLLWLNPLLGHDAYQPLCQGMRTALPFIDDFLPAHNLESLAGLVRRLRKIWR